MVQVVNAGAYGFKLLECSRRWRVIAPKGTPDPLPSREALFPEALMIAATGGGKLGRIQ
jgi:hypothetical protein